jgi:hypothetical protein
MDNCTKTHMCIDLLQVWRENWLLWAVPSRHCRNWLRTSLIGKGWLISCTNEGLC